MDDGGADKIVHIRLKLWCRERERKRERERREKVTLCKQDAYAGVV